ncbi:HEAT repeat domain-containing protein [Actinoallomurus vinaceus]
MLPPTATDDDLVRVLGNAPRATAAYFTLLGRGMTAVPAIRQRLRDADAGVREQCCRLLDQLLVEDALDDLVAMLDEENARVRVAALHALSCGRCKQDSCRPAKGSVLPPAIRLLAQDPDPHVQAMAVELVGRLVGASQCRRGGGTGPFAGRRRVADRTEEGGLVRPWRDDPP